MTQGAVNLGSAYGEILIDTSKLQGQLNAAFQEVERQAGSALGRLGDRIQNVGDRIQNVGKAFAPVSLAAGVAAGAGLKAFASFDDALIEIEARTGATAEQMDLVRQKALELGKAHGGPTRVTEAMLQLLASGYDINQTFTALPAILNAAAAGQMDLGYTADVVTDVLAMFNLEADKAAMVSDILAKAAGASSAEIDDLAAGFGNVGPIAAQFGLDVEETAAILAIFAENGVKGAEAGTQLKSMLTQMARPTKEVQETWERLGISLFDTAGQVRPLQDVMADLQRKLATMSDKERIQTMNALAGSFGQVGATILTSNMSIDEMVTLMNEQASAADVAHARLSSFNGIIMRLKSSIETFMITTMGPAIEQYLKPFAESVIGVVDRLTEWMAAHPKIAAALTGFIALLAGLSPALMLVGKAVAILGGMIGALTSPITLAVLAVVGLVAAFKTNFLGIRDAVQPVIDAVSNVVHWLGEAFKVGQAEGGIFGGVVASLKALFYVYKDGKTTFFSNILKSFGLSEKAAQTVGLAIVGIKDAVESVFEFVVGIVENDLWNELEDIWDALKVGDVGGVLSGIGNLLLAIGNVIVSYLPEVKAKLLEWGKAFVDWVREVGPPLLQQIYELLGQVGIWILETAPKLLEKLWEWGKAFVEWIAPMIPPFLEEMGKLALALIEWLANAAVDIAEKLWEWGKEFGKWLAPHIPTILEKLGEFITNVWNWIKETAPKIAEKLWDWAKAFIEWVVPQIPKLLEKLGELITNVWNWIKEEGPKLLEKLGEWGKQFIEWVGPEIPKLLEKLGELITSVWDWIKEEGPKLLEKLGDWGKQFVEWVGPEIPKLLKKLGELITSVWDWIKEEAPKLLEKLGEWGQKFVDWVGPAIDSLIEELGKLATRVYDWVTEDLIPGIVDKAKEVGGKLVEGIKNGINDGWDAFISWVEDKLDGLPGVAKKILGIESPSTVFKGFGENILAGLKNGLANLAGLTLQMGIVLAVITGAGMLMNAAAQMAGANIVSGLIWGMQSQAYALYMYAYNLATQIATIIRNALQIFSPSRVMADLGAQIPAGLALGMTANFAPVQAAAGQMAAATVPAGAGGGSNGGVTVNVQISDGVMQRNPDAYRWGQDAGRGIQEAWNQRGRGGGVVGLGS